MNSQLSLLPHRFLLALLSMVLAEQLGAQQWIDLQPLTSEWLMVHIDEGTVEHHKKGQSRSDEVLLSRPLDTDRASDARNYEIVSQDDPVYEDARQPVSIGRKSKGTDFVWMDASGVDVQPECAREHWLYLKLPEPLIDGKTYSVRLNALVDNFNERTILYQSCSSRSEAVHVNEIGYVPSAPVKYGYIYHWMGDQGSLDVANWVGRAFHLVNQHSGSRVFSGQLAFRAKKTLQETSHLSDSPPYGNFSGCDVLEAEFSDWHEPGVYVLEVPGMGCSFPFEIAEDVYRKVFVPVARSLYHNRSGIALTQPYTEFTRPAPARPGVTPGYELYYTTARFMDWPHGEGSWDDRQYLKERILGPLESWGFYQDAGDWDSYVQHLRIAQEALTVIEIAPDRFSDGELNIPESGNGIPDYLDEAMWLPKFCYRLRHELLEKHYGSGGLGLRVCGDPFGADYRQDGSTKGSWEDVDRIYVASGEDPWSTYRYAGTAAHLALVLKKLGRVDPDGIDWQHEAEVCLKWADDHHSASDETRDPVYWLYALRDQRMYALANLFRLTGDSGYLERFMEDFEAVPQVQSYERYRREHPDSAVPFDDYATSLEGEQMYGPWCLLLPGGKMELPREERNRVLEHVLHAATRNGIESSSRRAMRWGGDYNFEMLVGQQTTPLVLDSVVAWALLKDENPELAEKFLSVVYTTADYFLGTNPLNMVWISGVGARNPVNIFHMDAWYNGKGRCHPGVIPYGPWKVVDDSVGGHCTDIRWPFKTIYPTPISQWPGAERWFEQRSAPLTNEFTVHQNAGPAAAVYGFLCAGNKRAN